MVDYLKRQVYGSKSETAKALDIQISLFDEAEVESDVNAVEPTLEEIDTYRRKKYKGQRKDKLKDLPHDKVLIKTFEEDTICEACGTQMKRIGEEFVRTEVEFIPAKLRVIDYYREVYECRTCRKNGDPYIEKSPMPDPVIPHSFASASSVAYVMHQKFTNGMPLYRQEAEWKNSGLNLSRATMSNWILIASNQWLKPLVDRMHEMMVKEKYLHADETRVQVLREKNRSAQTKSYMWVYSTAKECTTPMRIYEYHPTRNGDNAKQFLKAFSGFLISDAYQAYNKVDNITRCYCWSHLRRCYTDSLPKNHESMEYTLPATAINYCANIFAIEKTIAGKSAEERLKVRQERIKPIVDDFFAWANDIADRKICLPKSKLGKAITYTLNQKEGLTEFLNDGNIPCTNNLAENTIRPFTVGRRAWLFSGSPDGAKASAYVYSIVETAKANNINPFRYLSYVLKNMPGLTYDENPEFLDDLLPWSEEIQNVCKVK